MCSVTALVQGRNSSHAILSRFTRPHTVPGVSGVRFGPMHLVTVWSCSAGDQVAWLLVLVSTRDTPCVQESLLICRASVPHTSLLLSRPLGLRSFLRRSAAVVGMIHPNDYKRQPHGAQSCKDASANGRPSCIMTSCCQCSPTERWEWQQSLRLDRSNSTKTLREELLEHQSGVCVNIMLVIFLSYLLFQDLRNRTGGFFMLSYPLESLYGIGTRDFKLVFGFMTFFTAARVAVMDYVLKPLAVKLGVTKPKTQTRFAEQSYMIIYYTIFWSWVLKIFIDNTPTEANGVHALLWSGFPHLRLQAALKFYYLS
jgi:hypothetical protein